MRFVVQVVRKNCSARQLRTAARVSSYTGLAESVYFFCARPRTTDVGARPMPRSVVTVGQVRKEGKFARANASFQSRSKRALFGGPGRNRRNPHGKRVGRTVDSPRARTQKQRRGKDTPGKRFESSRHGGRRALNGARRSEVHGQR